MPEWELMFGFEPLSLPLGTLTKQFQAAHIFCTQPLQL